MAAVTEALIEDVVRGFYGRVRDNPELGPIFDGAIQEWEPHLLKMMDFWSAVMLSNGSFPLTYPLMAPRGGKPPLAMMIRIPIFAR